MNLHKYFNYGNILKTYSENNDYRKILSSNFMGMNYSYKNIDIEENDHITTELFIIACSHWMQGDDKKALAILKNLKTQEAYKLQNLISLNKIHVVGQFSWNPSLVKDNKFEIHSVGIERIKYTNNSRDLNTNTVDYPFLSLKSNIPRGIKPAFYFGHMLEWHHLPYDLSNIDFPVFGSISDYDVHIQNVMPFLNAFDGLITAGNEEHENISQITNTPIWTFPKLFHIKPEIYSLQLDDNIEREYSLLLSGTHNSPFNPDKIKIVNKILSSNLRDVNYVDGWMDEGEYGRRLNKAKLGLSYVRFAGLNTRALEALSMGCAVLAQKDSVLPLFFDETYGVRTYGDNLAEIPEKLNEMINDWDILSINAKSGSARVRDEFEVSQTISKLLRFLTILSVFQVRKKELKNPHQKKVFPERTRF